MQSEILNFMNRVNGSNRLNSLNVQNTNKIEDQTQFKDVMSKALRGIEQTEETERAMNMDLVTGELENLHSVMISAEKADIVLSLTLQIRNKVIDAYDQVMRMQI